jgi:hypothetical protein
VPKLVENSTFQLIYTSTILLHTVPNSGCNRFSPSALIIMSTLKNELEPETTVIRDADSELVTRRDESFYFVDVIFQVGRNIPLVVRPITDSCSFYSRLNHISSKCRGHILNEIRRDSPPCSNFPWHRMCQSRDLVISSLYVSKESKHTISASY